MITGFFISLITAIAAFFVSFLPVYNIPVDWVNAVNLVWGYMNSLSFLLPIGTLLTVVGIAMLFHVTVFVWNVFLKLYHMVRG